VKRNSQGGADTTGSHNATPSPFSMETMLTSSLRRRLSSPGPTDKQEMSKHESEKVSKARDTLCRQIAVCCADWLNICCCNSF